MPAPVPPGFTRGPIMFMGPLTDAHFLERMLQSFWDEAGGYGARILIVPTADPADSRVETYRRWLLDAEVDWVKLLPADDRRAARDPALAELVDTATGILLTDGNPLRLTGILGGTPAAQAIRRANARGRVICAVGQSSGVLSQHMPARPAGQDTTQQALTPSLVQFAPGLGIVNRVTVDCDRDAGADLRAHLPRLLTAVAYNPFLIGVAIDPNTGIVIYANSTLEVFGAGSALVVDGWQIDENNLYAAGFEEAFQLTGAEIHTLAHGYTYNLDTHQANRPPENDIPKAGYEKYSSF